MKKLITSALFLLIATPAIAGQQHHHRGGDRWVAPLVGGIILGALISKQNEVVIDERSTYVAPPPIVHYPVGPQFYNCLVRVYDQRTGTYRNEVMTCVR